MSLSSTSIPYSGPIHTNSAALAATKSDGAMADLYRAVSPEEFADILRTRSFRPRPGGESLDAKQFARSLHETIALANYLPDTAAVIAVAPTSFKIFGRQDKIFMVGQQVFIYRFVQ